MNCQFDSANVPVPIRKRWNIRALLADLFHLRPIEVDRRWSVQRQNALVERIIGLASYEPKELLLAQVSLDFGLEVDRFKSLLERLHLPGPKWILVLETAVNNTDGQRSGWDFRNQVNSAHLEMYGGRFFSCEQERSRRAKVQRHR